MAKPPPRPEDRGELKYKQSGGSSSEKALDSPGEIQVSVMQGKSIPWEVKNSFRIEVLFVTDLVFTASILMGARSKTTVVRGERL